MKTPLETALSDDLSQIVTAQPFLPDVDAIERRGRQLRRRGAAARGVTGLAAVAGVAAIALAVASAQPGVTRSPRASAVPKVSAKTIEARTLAAISSAAPDSVLRTVVVTAAGVSRYTVDAPGQATERVRTNKAGRTTEVTAIRQDPGTAGVYQMITIDFVSRTWSETDLHAPSTAPAIENPAKAIAAQLHQDETVGTNGHARVVGTAIIDGQRAYTILLTGPGAPPSKLWISQATSLPIKAASQGADVTYHWSAPSAGAAASLWPSIPAGSTKVAAPPVGGR